MIKNCKQCNELLILKPFKVDKKIYNKSIFIIYDKLKNVYCSLFCITNK